ncbi:MAG: chaperonin HslO, partial [Vibrio sp.]|nr:chaperonin HslO [Vibrio sp.]
SEQVPSRIKLTIAELDRKGEAPIWVSGGMLVQRIASDEARGDTSEVWREAEALFGTLSDAELVDPDLAMPDLLFRL